MNRLTECITMLCLVIMTLDVTFTVFMRYVMDTGYPWGEEIALLSWIWLGFLSSSLAVRDDTHLKLTFYDRFLSARFIQWSNTANTIIMLMFCVFGVILGGKMCFVARFSELPGTGLNTLFVYLPVPFGFILTGYYLALDLAGRKADGDNDSNHDTDR